MAKTVIGLEVSMNSSGAEGSVKSLKAQLREAQAEVATMSEKFGLTSEEAQKAAQKAAKLKDAIGDAKTLTDAFNPDAKFKSFSNAIQGVVGGFSALQGAQALFGSQSEDVAKVLAKVQGAMALSQGVNSILEAGDAFKILGGVIKTNVVTAFSTLRGAIISTGIGALIVAVGLLVNKLMDYSDAADKAAESQKKLNEQTKRYAEIELQGNIDSLNRQEKLDVAKAKAKGASEKEIFDIQQKYSELKFNAQKKYNNEVYGQDAEADIKNKSLLLDYLTEAQIRKDEFASNELQKRKEHNQKILDADKDLKNKLATLNEQNYLSSIENDNERERAKIKWEYDKNVAEINSSIAHQTVKNELLSALKYKYNSDNQILDEKVKKEQLAREQALSNAIVQLKLTEYDAIGAGIGILKMFSEKNKGLQKAALIAENAITIAKIILNTQAANAAVTAKYALIPGGQPIAAAEILANKIKAGIGIATAIAATAKGLAGIGGGGSAGGGGNLPEAGGASAPIGAQMGATALQQAQINAAGNAAVQAFVLESDVSGNQERIERLNRAARIQ
jgi:hypothetical protein